MGGRTPSDHQPHIQDMSGRSLQDLAGAGEGVARKSGWITGTGESLFRCLAQKVLGVCVRVCMDPVEVA